jgi:hypothetical protein
MDPLPQPRRPIRTAAKAARDVIRIRATSEMEASEASDEQLAEGTCAICLEALFVAHRQVRNSSATSFLTHAFYFSEVVSVHHYKRISISDIASSCCRTNKAENWDEEDDELSTESLQAGGAACILRSHLPQHLPIEGCTRCPERRCRL